MNNFNSSGGAQPSLKDALGLMGSFVILFILVGFIHFSYLGGILGLFKDAFSPPPFSGKILERESPG